MAEGLANVWEKRGRYFHHNVLLKAAVIVSELVILGGSLYLAERQEDLLFLSFGVGGLAIINFIVFFQSDESDDDQPGETRGAAMRRAIAGSVVVTYLILVAVLAFNPDLQTIAGSENGCGLASGTADAEADCLGISRDLINRLGVVVGAISVFYFGTTTLEEWIKARQGGNGGNGGGAPDAGAGDPEPGSDAGANEEVPAGDSNAGG